MPWDSCTERVTDPATGVVHEIATLKCIEVIFQNMISAFLGFAGITALAFIIYSGFKYITSEGDQKNIDEARKTLTFAIVGLVVVLISFFVINFISFFTGVDCINQFGFEVCPR